MMFIKSIKSVCPGYLKISKRLLSNEIKEVLKLRLDPPGNSLQFAFVSKNLNAVNLDLFVNTISHQEDRTSDVLDLVANLRRTKLANSVLESTNFAVVGHLLENLTIQEVVPVLIDRPKYGIFLNDFTAFAVTQILHEEKEYILCLPLLLKLVLAEEINSEFVIGFCLKSGIETLKNKYFSDQSPETPPSPTKGIVQEKKIRVKFIRNVEEPDFVKKFGKVLLKIESGFLKEGSSVNAKILGLTLTKNHSELNEVLSKNIVGINEDVADICKKVLSLDNQQDLANRLGNLQHKGSFENFVDSLLKESSIKEPAALSEKQKQLLQVWKEVRTQKKIEFEHEVAKKDRKEKIDSTMSEIAAKKELLWFFDNEDKIDLEIYKKEEISNKKWFNKNKQSSDAEEEYVPPEIR